MADGCAGCRALEARIRELEKENEYLQLFKSGMDNISSSRFAVLSRDHRFEAVSRGYLDAYHRKSEEIIGKKAAEVLDAQAFHTVAEPCFAKALEGRVVHHTTWAKMPDAQERFLELHYFPIADQGIIYRVAILVHDLTQASGIRGASVESTANFPKARRMMIPHIGNWTWDIKDDRLWGSNEFFRILGVDHKGLVLNHGGYSQFIHPQDRNAYRDMIVKVIKTGLAYTRKYRIIRPDREIRTVIEQGKVIGDAGGAPARLFATIQDVTGRSVQAGKQYQTIIQTAIDGFVMLDEQGRLMDVNEAYCRMVGYTREELLHMNVSDLDIKDIRLGEMVQFFRSVAQTGSHYLETRHRHKTGRLVDVQISLQCSDARNGMFFSFVQDITEKKQIREALKNSEAKYHDLFESAPVMYVVLEKQQDDAVLKDCNRLFLETLGYPRTEVIDRFIGDFYTPDSLMKMRGDKNFKQIRENTFSVAERELVCRSGEIIHTLLQAKPDLDDHGKLIGIRCMYTNISAQKKAQEQLKESNHLLIMILDGIGEPLIILDRNMGVLMMNRAAEICTEKAGSQCLGQKCHQIFKSAPQPCTGCGVEQVLGSGEKAQYERAGLMNPDVLERVTVYPIVEKGHQAWAAIVRVSDITLERQMEKELIQADKMISLGILVSGVAHEINNPNHLIMSNTPLLIEAWKSIVPMLDRYCRENGDFSLAGLPYSRMSEEIPQLFEGILKGSARIHRIVRVVKNAVCMTRNLIHERTDHFSLAYGRCMPRIRGNRQKLEQVVINLIQNACQAISERGQGLEITTFPEPDLNCLCVRVKDQGDGIPASLMERIMDPFFTTRRGQDGTGLGLAVCLNIVTTHGGKIEVASKPGQGSVFTVNLPLNAAPKDCLCIRRVPGEWAGFGFPGTVP